MIDYTPNESSIYLENKEFCETVEDHFKKYNANYSGYCDRYGFKIISNFTSNNLQFFIKYEKNQSTQGQGLFWHPNAINSISIKIKITGINNQKSYSYGENWFFKTFIKREIKTTEKEKSFISKYIEENKVVKLILRKNILTIWIDDTLFTPIEILKNLNTILIHWA